MSYKIHMKGYEDFRTLAQIDRLYAWKHKLDFSPTLIEINPTSQCNQSCIYCYTNKRIENHSYIKDEVFIDSFRQFAKAGVSAAVLQGTGEPLMHKALPDAVESAGKHNISLALTTNGVLLVPKLQERILEHLLYIRFSVLDSNPSRYSYLHGCSEKQWEILHENIKSIVAARDKFCLELGLCITVYLYQDNYKDICSIIKFYKDIGIDYIFIQEATYSNYSPAGKRGYFTTQLSESEKENIKKDIMLLSDDDCRVKIEYPTESLTKNWELNKCQGIKFFTLLSCDGGIYPCWRCWGQKEYCYGSLYEQQFEEIWSSDKRKELESIILKTSPNGDECMNCNNPKLNRLLNKYQDSNTKWKDFIL